MIIRFNLNKYMDKSMENMFGKAENKESFLDESGSHGNAKDQDAKTKNLEILNSFTFYEDNQDFVESLKKGFLTLDLGGLDNSVFIDLEAIANSYGQRLRSEYSNIDLVEKLTNQNNKSKILLYAFSDLDTIRKIKPKIDLLLAKENVKFTRLPFTAEDAISILNSGMNEEVTGEKLQDVQDKEISHKVGTLLHMIHISSPDEINNLKPEDIPYLPKMLMEAKLYFPTLEDKTPKEVVEFLFAIRQNVSEVMKGQNIEGVYCDIEGTLFNGEELNKKTLDILKGFEEQGKNITLWTDGDISKLQELLDRDGIKYPLKSKIDHAGVSAEIVIDNDDNNTFSAKTKIYAKKFIKV